MSRVIEKTTSTVARPVVIAVSCDILGTGRGVIAHLSNVPELTVWTRRLSTCQGKLRRRHQGRCDRDYGRDSRARQEAVSGRLPKYRMQRPAAQHAIRTYLTRAMRSAVSFQR